MGANKREVTHPLSAKSGSHSPAKNMAEANAAQFRSEGESAFSDENKENENSPSSPEVKETDTDPTGQPDQKKDGGEDHGFLDHPAWKEREASWKNRYNEQETRHTTEIQSLREGMEKSIADAVNMALKQAGVSDRVSAEDIPEWFGTDDPRVWSGYKAHTEKLVQSAVEQALKLINSKTAEEQKVIDDATAYFQKEVAAIEGDKELNPEGRKIDRNKLLKVALDNELVDTKGRWNYKAAFRMMKPDDVFQAKQALRDRKQIAGATTDNARTDQKQPNVTTSKDFENPSNRPW